MAGLTKKKRTGGNVQKLWEGKEAYGTGFHNKLFSEEAGDVDLDKKDLEECGEDVNRISQLLDPEAGG